MHIIIACLISLILILYNLLKSLLLLFVPRWLRNKKCIKGSRVLITGAGNGLGRELAIEFSKYSVCLILVDIDRPSLMQTEKLLDRRSTVFIYDVDVSDHRKVYEMAKMVQNEAGDIDILVNNAGIMSRKYLLELEEEKVMKTMKVNVLAHFWMCKAFLPAMMAKNKGHIVNIVSMASKAAMPGLSDYCASKYAAAGFTESLAAELKVQKLNGIKVTIVNPSLIGTDMFQGLHIPLVNILPPKYVAQEVVDAVLMDEEAVYLPHSIKPGSVILDIVPRWLKLKMYEMVGLLKAFDDFKGKSESEIVTRDKSKKKI